MTQFITRAYNNIQLDHVFDIITKSSTESRLLDETSYYISLPKELQIFFPRLIGFNKDSELYSMQLEFYAYKNIAQYYLDDSEISWERVIIKLLSSIEKFKEFPSNLQKDDVQLSCSKIFIEKTVNEYHSLVNNFPFFKELSKFDNIIINNVSYKNLNHIWGEIKIRINTLIREQESFNVIHGDMCFSNILLGYGDNIAVKFIDPRGSFGEKGVYGSSLYDYAKLLHSIDGNYESIIYDKFYLSNINNRFQYNIFNNKQNEKACHDIIRSSISEKEFSNSKLIEGLIFIGMCARHYDSLERQKMMYITGIRILNEVLNENMH